MTTEPNEPAEPAEPNEPAEPTEHAAPSTASEPAETDQVRSRPAQEVALALFDYRLAQIAARETARIGRRNLWLAHHWPADYGERCVRIGSRPVCRRCAALYPLGFAVAFLAAAGLPPWPAAFDPMAIWLLSVPASVAYVAEAVGLMRYRPRWQVGTTLLAALAFGRALGYELVDRWSPEFWGPIAVFGGIWFLATVFNASATTASRASSTVAAQSAATASSSSSSVL